MDVDKTIEEHYGRGGLEESILAGLVSLGRDIDDIDLTPEFVIDKQESRLRYALEFTADTTPTSPPPIGLHLVLGQNVGARMKNITAAMTQGILAPIEILSHRA